MKNLSINMKLIVGFGIVLVLLLSSIVLSIYSINRVGEQVELYGNYTLPNNNSIGIVHKEIISAQRYLAQAFIETDAQTVQGLLAEAEQNGKNALQETEKYANNQRNSDRDAQIKELESHLEQVAGTRTQIASLLQNPTEENKQKGYALFLNEYKPGFDQAAAILTEFAETAAVRAEQQKADAKGARNLAWILLLACSVVSLFITIIVIISIRKAILNPVREIERVYHEMAKGNMQVEVNYDGRDELGNMARLIREANQMQSTVLGDVIEKFTKISQGDMRIQVDLDYPGDFAILKQVIENTVTELNQTLITINAAAEQVSTGAAQVASGAQALATGSTEQAASAEELSTAITSIAQQAEENSTNVKAAAQHIAQTGSSVNIGDEYMQRLTKAMANIDSASSQIANITKVIEDIAFQTNILALHAAIEAARAGSAGKGFAVVADEVRNLAAKSAEAAKQTADLIHNSTSMVSEGSELTQQTANILRDIHNKSELVNASIVKIEQATIDQAGAIEQIQQGLSQVSAVVQTNAASAEENSATSEEMSAQAVTLREEVGKFKLSDQGQIRHAASAYQMEEPIEEEIAEWQSSDTFEKY